MKNLQIMLVLLALIAGCGKKSGSQGIETVPGLSCENVSMAEGTNSTSNLELKLTLDHGSSKSVTVMYSTIDGTAKSGADFTPVTNQTITFQPNETEKKVTVSVVADDLKEADEVFQVQLQNPVNAVLVKTISNIILKNDDTRIGFNNTGFEAATAYAGYTLFWNDEFNGSALDVSAWSNESGDGCPGLCNWGNNELQYYTSPPNNLFFQDGKMIIEAKAESFGGKNYTSARIKTQHKKTFQFGRIDIRAIMPKGKGLWPAFWLLPQDNVYGGWPKSGEIDMMELVGQEPSKVSGTLHYGPGPNSTYISRNYFLPASDFNDQFHVFSIEWSQDQIKWYVDDNLYSTINKTDMGANIYPFNEKFYFIINLSVGGNLPGAPDASTLFPQWLIIDYIRVYQK